MTLARLRKLQMCAKQVTTGVSYVQDVLRPDGLVLEYPTAAAALTALSTSICDAFVFDLPSLIAAKQAAPGRYGALAGRVGSTEHYGAVLSERIAVATGGQQGDRVAAARRDDAEDRRRPVRQRGPGRSGHPLAAAIKRCDDTNARKLRAARSANDHPASLPDRIDGVQVVLEGRTEHGHRRIERDPRRDPDEAPPDPRHLTPQSLLQLQRTVGNTRATRIAHRSAGGRDAGPRRLARFVESEHKLLGDLGSGGGSYTRAGLELTHGDLTFLSGDHFEPDELIQLWDKPSKKTGEEVGTQDEILYCIKWQLGDKDERFLSGGKWHDLTFSDEVKARVESHYYELASKNTMHFANPGLPGFGRGGFPPGSAGATYHERHENAIKQAYQAGLSGGDISPAKELEATGDHFLTDAFAAGHLSTPRASISEYWNGMYPMFEGQFKTKVAHDIGAKLEKEATWAAGSIPESVYESSARDMLEEKLKGLPIRMGDILSDAVHGYDNDRGLWVTNDLGWHWIAWGDGKLMEGTSDVDASPGHTNLEAATLAVSLGIVDLETAYGMGKRDTGSPLDEMQVLDQVKQRPGPPVSAGDKYGPEQVMPRLDPSIDQGTLGWRVDSIQTLWETRVRSTDPTTFGDFLTKDMQVGGSIGDELESKANDIDEEVNPYSQGWAKLSYVAGPVVWFGHGHIFPRQAFKEAVLDQLRERGRCLAFLLDVVSK